MKRNYKLREGEKLSRPPNKPILGITGNGEKTYLWVGNNAPNDMMCFATLSGPKTLKLFAHSILKAIR